METNNTQNWAIIIDPGHGGPDHGCASSTGRLEKNIVLTLAKQLQERIKQQGIQVHLTRETDTQKTHFERIQIAKQNQGQLFLSLHCNTSFSPHEKGIRIYLNNPKGRIRFPNTTKTSTHRATIKSARPSQFFKAEPRLRTGTTNGTELSNRNPDSRLSTYPSSRSLKPICQPSF